MKNDAKTNLQNGEVNINWGNIVNLDNLQGKGKTTHQLCVTKKQGGHTYISVHTGDKDPITKRLQVVLNPDLSRRFLRKESLYEHPIDAHTGPSWHGSDVDGNEIPATERDLQASVSLLKEAIETSSWTEVELTALQLALQEVRQELEK